MQTSLPQILFQNSFLFSSAHCFLYKRRHIPLLGDRNLHFSVPSMKRPNQTEPETLSILLCWSFLGILFFSILAKIDIFNIYGLKITDLYLYDLYLDLHFELVLNSWHLGHYGKQTIRAYQCRFKKIGTIFFWNDRILIVPGYTKHVRLDIKS
jgi:hypothetical protein